MVDHLSSTHYYLVCDAPLLISALLSLNFLECGGSGHSTSNSNAGDRGLRVTNINNNLIYHILD
jgi:hypothetical protein